ncbi:thioesterase domain-containing protein [Pseudomonas rubra]|uniref:Thioesterase domain-containing protein n=1 Tax=Pseudomonas rubra TaxID=2942627 RepID=A0ABT5P352_9PSED|nr:thioesterase domain-containing protein [Pseudomonas rubra]MDD1012704.1 thioesterase domain-containing protein [Pseudomonas rubra]MDD1041588.1 thioesterase domain-containing protein [Pseudomonas rubra]MDD1155524.1 thioesterase domain-containing protein [Pseudomonas rubra]
MKLICFPDFVGHPICFSALARQLKGRALLTTLNYSDYWPYPSIEVLAERIADGHDLAAMDLVLGYSFGARVAACCVSQQGAAQRLCLVDPPAVASVQGHSLQSIAQRLATDPQYAYIDDLVDAQLVERDCVLGNIQMLAHLSRQPLPIVPVDVLLSAQSSVSELAQELGLHRAACHRYHVALGTSHASVINDPCLAALIMQSPALAWPTLAG